MKYPQQQPTSIARHVAAVGAAHSTLLLAAVLLVVVEAPWPIRLLAVPVLLLVPGAAVVSILFARREDAAVRWSLVGLSGLLTWLVVALVVNVSGAPITATYLALGVGAIGVLVTVAGRRHRQGTGPVVSATGILLEARRRIRIAGALLGSVMVLSGALFVAEWIQPDRREAHTSLGFTDTVSFAEGRKVVKAGERTRLNWALRGYGLDLSASAASLRLTVDGVALDDVAVDMSPSTTPDVENATSTVLGAVTFAAPRNRGRHVVALTVIPASGDGRTVTEPGFISTILEVT